jgi:formylglycine-generating enzyme required for sulfatase activity
VREWMNDRYNSNYYRRSPRANPQGPKTGERRVLRGGSWSVNDSSVRSAARVNLYPGIWGGNGGFRCVRSP